MLERENLQFPPLLQSAKTPISKKVERSQRYRSKTRFSRLSWKKTPGNSAVSRQHRERGSEEIELREIVEWFVTWSSWQQKTVLSGIIDRCSRDQLTSLNSSLEPVFHRDFVQSHGEYPTEGFRRMYRRQERGYVIDDEYEEPETEIQPDLQETEEVISNANEVPEEDWDHCLISTADQLVNWTLKNAFDIVQAEFDMEEILDTSRRPSRFLNDRRRSSLFGQKIAIGRPSVSNLSMIAEEKNTKKKKSCMKQISIQDVDSLVSPMETTDITEKANAIKISVSLTARFSKKKLPHQKRIKRIFNWQLRVVWKWLDDWGAVERMRLLAEVVHLCGKGEIQFILQCMNRRLFDDVDIHALSHKTMFQIFSHLTIDDVENTAQVCRRWYHLARSETIWRPHCMDLGRKEDLGDVLALLRRRFPAPVPIDWRIGYRYLIVAAEEFRQERVAREAAIRAQELAAAEEARKLQREMWDMMRGHEVQAMRPPSIVSSGPEDITQTDELIDTRPLMKPILGRIKRFQESEDIALDVRSELKSKKDNLGVSEEKEQLHYRSQLAKTGQPGNLVAIIRPVQICRRLTGHLDGVLCLRFDTRRIISGSMDRSVRLWDVKSGRSMHKFYGHKGGVLCVTIKDNLVVSGSWDMLVMMWSLEPTFERIGVLHGHRDSVTFVCILEQNIISGSLDGTVRIYGRYGHGLERVIDYGSGVETGWADEAQLITGHTNRTIRLTSFPDGQMTHVLRGHRDPVLTLAVSNQLLVSGDQNGNLFFWNRTTGDQEAAIQALPNLSLTSVVLHRGNFWTAHGDGSVREWHMPTMTCVRTLVGHKGTVRQIQVSRERVASAGLDASIRIWDFRPFLDHGPTEHEVIKPKLLFPSLH